MSTASPSMSSSSSSMSKHISPQATGFSQMHGRVGAGEGGGQAMSVLLSWHEKVSPSAFGIRNGLTNAWLGSWSRLRVLGALCESCRIDGPYSRV